MDTKKIGTNCNKFIEVYPGVISFQACSCEKCLASKKATKEFFVRFDSIYEEYKKNQAPVNSAVKMQTS